MEDPAQAALLPKRKLKYKFQIIRSKGAIVVIIVSGALMRIFQFCYLYIAVAMWDFKNYQVPKNFNLIGFEYIVMLFYPIGGLMADMCIGRYRMIIGSTLFCIIVWLIMTILIIIMWIYNDTLQEQLAPIVIVCLLMLFVGQGGFLPNLIPFNIDQLMGASGDELSATIYWHSFCTLFVPVVMLNLHFLAIHYIENNLYLRLALSLSVGTISLMLVLIIDYFCNHWLDTTPQFYNPIKLIFQVLNYARRNKYPRNRSALTFWENSIPSRLDLGKDKYGGPFTIEQVEDVRTFLKLLPLLLCFTGLSLSVHVGLLTWELSKSVFISPTEILFSLIFIANTLNFLLCSIYILLYQFILYPCFANYIPSMLKKISVGLVCSLVTLLSCIILRLIGGVTFHSAPSVIQVDYKWIIVPQFISSIALILVRVSSIEFIVAQSPISMRGLMVGLWYASEGFGQTSYALLSYIAQRLTKDNNEILASLYTDVFNSVVLLLILIIFVIASTNYKLRIRENIVPINQIAEEHYERYQEQSDQYRRDRGLSSYTDSY